MLGPLGIVNFHLKGTVSFIFSKFIPQYTLLNTLSVGMFGRTGQLTLAEYIYLLRTITKTVSQDIRDEQQNTWKTTNLRELKPEQNFLLRTQSKVKDKRKHV